jgi:hypothetical protein
MSRQRGGFVGGSSLPELYLRQQTERDRNPPGLVCLGAGMGLIRLRIEHLIGKHLLISHPGASVESPPAAPAVLLADHSSAGGEPAAPLNGTVDRPVIWLYVSASVAAKTRHFEEVSVLRKAALFFEDCRIRIN